MAEEQPTSERPQVDRVIKRDGREVPFDVYRIRRAITRAMHEVNQYDEKKLSQVVDYVVQVINENYSRETPPHVEDIQDIIEYALVKHGLFQVAKAYILYRKERERIRKEKMAILGKEYADEVDKRLSLNAIRLLASRYLMKDEEGRLIEDPKGMFVRVAALVVIPDVLYDPRVYDKTGSQPVHPREDFDLEEWEGKVGLAGIGGPEFAWNRYHLERMKALYDELNSQGKMKVPWSRLWDMILAGEFDDHYWDFLEYYRLMSELRFLPNSPTLFNAGTRLGQLSACFLPDQLVLTQEGPKPIVDIREGERVLTHTGRYLRVTETFARPYAGEILRIDVEKLPRSTLAITPEHPVLAVRREKLSCVRDGSLVCRGVALGRCLKVPGEYSEECTHYSELVESLEWISAADLREGDYVAISYPRDVQDVESIDLMEYLDGEKFVDVEGMIYRRAVDKRKRTGVRVRGRPVWVNVKPVRRRVPLDEDVLLLFGYYLSEGDAGDTYLRFTFSSKELDRVADVARILEEKFGVPRESMSLDVHRGWITLRVFSSILGRFFTRLFGRGYSQKRVPGWILLLPPEKQRHLLIGMFRGDGTLIVSKVSSQARLVLENPNLVYAAFLMLLRCGIVPKLGRATKPPAAKITPWYVTVSAGDAREFIEEIFGVSLSTPKRRRRYSRAIWADGLVLLRVKRIEREPYVGFVYNLEVEEDHTYSASCVAVHNCFVLDMEDSLNSIMKAAVDASKIFQSGGGIGINYSKLRPEGDIVRSTNGRASGPVSFMRIIDVITDVVKQGGRRRGANMGILEVWHPDIWKFIECKSKPGQYENFNISVMITGDFWEAYEKDEPYSLINPRNGEVWGTSNSRELFRKIAELAWKTGDPGVLFADNINKRNVLKSALGEIKSTNPCGEEPLYPYESCNLGSINLYAYVRVDEDTGAVEFDWEAYARDVRLALRFLDNVIDVNKFPLPEIERQTKLTRKVGLGLMGLADVLFALGIPYHSEEGFEFMRVVTEHLTYHALEESARLASERGTFPLYERSGYARGELPVEGYYHPEWWTLDWSKLAREISERGVRNAEVTTIAPTGSISMIADVSSGIEPQFALVYEKRVSVGQFFYVDREFERQLKRLGLYSERLLKEVADNGGSVQGIEELPEELRRVFVVAYDIPWWDHVRAQAEITKWICAAVSKTINMPNWVTVDDVEKAYLFAHRLGLKGLTIYRDGSKAAQVLVTPSQRRGEYVLDVSNETLDIMRSLGIEPPPRRRAPSEQVRGQQAASAVFRPPPRPTSSNHLEVCPECGSKRLVHREDCVTCLDCGWSACVVT